MLRLREQTRNPLAAEDWAPRVATFGAYWIAHRRALAVCLGAAGVFVWGAFAFGWPLWFVVAPVVAAATVGATMLGALNEFRASVIRPRIVPYFESSVPGVDTFFSGYALARWQPALDDLARQVGAAPLSAFGFGDAYRGDEAHWYSAEQGLAAVEPLLQAVREHPGAVPEPEAEAEELERLQARLCAAHYLRVGFCLHLRRDWAYTPREFRRRHGKY